jgi:hemerythrin
MEELQMAYFDWKPEYKVNVAAFDAQHKRLVDMLNELYDSMRAGKGNVVVGKVLDDLVDYTKKHLAEEERFLQTNSYPAFPEHKAEHIRLTAQVVEYQKQYKEGNVGISVKLGNFLKDWLIGHIQASDKKYAAFMNAKGIF